MEITTGKRPQDTRKVRAAGAPRTVGLARALSPRGRHGNLQGAGRWLRTRSSAFTITEILVAITILMILAGILSSGYTWLRARADEVTVMNQVQHVGSALQLYYVKHRQYPSAYPARLDNELAPYLQKELEHYVDNPLGFCNPTNPEAGAAPLNESYVTPPIGCDANRYVISMDPVRKQARSAILFADGATELAERLPVTYGDQPLKPGDTVVGGTLRFATDSMVHLGQHTMARMIHSFRTCGGTPFHIVKLPRYRQGYLQADVAGADMMQVVTGAGIVLVTCGIADIDVLPVASKRETDPCTDRQDDPIQATSLSLASPPLPVASRLAGFAVFSKTNLTVGGNANIDHLIGSDGDLVLAGNNSLRGIESGGSVSLQGNTGADGDVIVTGSMTLQGSATVRIGGNLDTSGPVALSGNASVGGHLVAGGPVSIAKNSWVGGDVATASNLTHEGKIYGSASYAGDLSLDKKAAITEGTSKVAAAEVSPQPYQPVTLPPPTAFTPGTEDVTISSKSSTLAPGIYRKLHISANCSVTFESGTYVFEEITTDGGPELCFDVDAAKGGIDIFVKNNITLGNQAASVLKGDATPRDIYLEVHGNLTTGSAAATWNGTIFAPNGEVKINGSFALQGACYAAGGVDIKGAAEIAYYPLNRQIGGTSGASSEEASDGDGSDNNDGDGQDNGPTNTTPLDTYVRVSNHSAHTSVDAQVTGRGDDVLYIERRPGCETGLRSRIFGRGANVPIGQWAEVIEFIQQ